MTQHDPVEYGRTTAAHLDIIREMIREQVRVWRLILADTYGYNKRWPDVEYRLHIAHQQRLKLLGEVYRRIRDGE